MDAHRDNRRLRVHPLWRWMGHYGAGCDSFYLSPAWLSLQEGRHTREGADILPQRQSRACHAHSSASQSNTAVRRGGIEGDSVRYPHSVVSVLGVFPLLPHGNRVDDRP